MEPNIMVLDAFVGMRIRFSLGISNNLLEDMAVDSSTLLALFDTYLRPYIKRINFNYIVASDEANENILSTLKTLQSIFNANTIGQIKSTTMLRYNASLDIKVPPSNGASILCHKKFERYNQLLDSTRLTLMVVVYPHLKFVNDNRDKHPSISYATFGATKLVHDGSLSYYNLFDAAMNTSYAAIKKLGVWRCAFGRQAIMFHRPPKPHLQLPTFLL